ncbi:hypothetical protein [Niabella drilacis]|uniref:Uncharacterized protein n=1 Tax=Niabella drilacis (strain DSM 25811 / CCM 8410 / CCUG 62505 / LMG 26954 / E90) TaxID=1285928 RepID=A0A1G6Z9Y5_NIADE|nr:hypothetical protein [Niabella drilacis]SDD98685.1 hypothetical protein SAMN04487894_11788 [Niabella drilacis]
MSGKGADTKQDFELKDVRQMLVLVRYKPAGTIAADAMLGGIADTAQGAIDKVEGAAASIPGLSLFFKEETEPEKKCDKEYTYYKDYKDWDGYMKKMKSELSDKLYIDNEVLVFDFEASGVDGRKQEAKKLCARIKAKTAGWEGYSSCFHFVGLGQGGNVANECIRELSSESSFKNKWWVQSLIYVATPLYRYQHLFDEQAAFKGKGKKYAFGNPFDLTAQVIEYFEPNDELRKLVAECNANTLSVFTGKIKARLVAALGNLLSIDGFGTGKDNAGHIDRLKQSKDEIRGLVEECISAVKVLVDAVPGLVKPGDLPAFDQLLQGFDAVPGQSVDRLEKFLDEIKNAAKGTSLDTGRIRKEKILNFLCPLVDKLTGMLQLFAIGSETSNAAFDKFMEQAKVKKILAPRDAGTDWLGVDAYLEKVAKMAEDAKKQEAEAKKDGKDLPPQTAAQLQYDQSVSMIRKCREQIAAVTKDKDLDLAASSLPDEDKARVAEAIAALLLPMMPSKKKFYAQVLEYLPLSGVNGFLAKLTGDAAFAPLQKLTGKVLGDFDEGTPEEPGLKTSIRNFDTELRRVKGFLNRNNYPVHKDVNSLYFIYNSHNLMLKKAYGPVLNAIDSETGYLDYMESTGNTHFFNLEQNEYRSAGAGPSQQAAPAVRKKET